MKRRAVLLCLLLGAMLLLSGCQKPVPDEKPPSEQSAPDAALTLFYFSESSSYVKPVQGYEFRAEDGQTAAYFYMSNEEEPYPVQVDQAWVDTLTGFISQYGMMAWDGFIGSATGLLDGTQFYVEFTLSDGTSVKAGGYGDFPDGYGGAAEAIDAHFMQLLPKDLLPW